MLPVGPYAAQLVLGLLPVLGSFAIDLLGSKDKVEQAKELAHKVKYGPASDIEKNELKGVLKSLTTGTRAHLQAAKDAAKNATTKGGFGWKGLLGAAGLGVGLGWMTDNPEPAAGPSPDLLAAMEANQDQVEPSSLDVGRNLRNAMLMAKLQQMQGDGGGQMMGGGSPTGFLGMSSLG